MPRNHSRTVWTDLSLPGDAGRKDVPSLRILLEDGTIIEAPVVLREGDFIYREYFVSMMVRDEKGKLVEVIKENNPKPEQLGMGFERARRK